MKRIIVCADGTWNKEEVEADSSISNVLKIARSIKSVGDDGIHQIVHYDEGVGTGWTLNKLVGGITGLGISKNIQEAYRFIINNYCEGDEIYLFGFSRGAYTVRSVGGLLSLFAKPHSSDMKYINEIYDYYRIEPKKRKSHSNYGLMQQIMFKSSPIKVKVIGVWDTVGALGVPTPILKQISQKFWVGFHDTELRNTEYAYHALAIDEKRGPFSPSVWTKAEGVRDVKQVWFSGVHSNVGGGYKDTGLSDIALEWMIKMTSQHGLAYDMNDLKSHILKPNVDGKLYQSKGWGYKLLNFLFVDDYLRPVGQKHQVKDGVARGVNEMIHSSALARFENNKLGWNENNFKFGVENLPVEKH